MLLLALIWTWNLAGTLEFEPGGILSAAYHQGRISRWGLGCLLALFAFGTGKAALMPFHRWLPAAMVAPTPVSALLHAVAVVKVGVFTVMKVAVYIFGIDLLQESGVSVWLMYVAGATVLLASLVALTKDNLKARLAYSTISQLSYITLGAALAQPWSVIGGQHAHRHARDGQDHFVLLCGGDLRDDAQDRDQSDARHRSTHARDDRRLFLWLAQHHRLAALRRRVEQMVPRTGGGRRRISPCWSAC